MMWIETGGGGQDTYRSKGHPICFISLSNPSKVSLVFAILVNLLEEIFRFGYLAVLVKILYTVEMGINFLWL